MGHDWGGGHVIGVAMTRPDLSRSWVSDAIGTFEPDYVWHDAAQIWQTPDEGERHLEQLFAGSVDDRAARMAKFGTPLPTAKKLAAGQDEDMARAMLSLCRSTAQPVLAEISRDLADVAARPGLVVIAAEDQAVGSLDARLRGAKRAEARVQVLDGLGHWWMLEDPAKGAHVLAQFWDNV